MQINIKTSRDIDLIKTHAFQFLSNPWNDSRINISINFVFHKVRNFGKAITKLAKTNVPTLKPCDCNEHMKVSAYLYKQYLSIEYTVLWLEIVNLERTCLL